LTAHCRTSARREWQVVGAHFSRSICRFADIMAGLSRRSDTHALT
jgi:hypothetical protein